MSEQQVESSSSDEPTVVVIDMSPAITVDTEPPIVKEDTSTTTPTTPTLVVFQHRCFKEGCDPMIGILNETASRQACCPYKSYLNLTPHSEEFKMALTPFGRRMMAVGVHYQVDIHRNVQNLDKHDKIVDFFRDYFRRHGKHFRDDDRVEWLFAECSICAAPCRFVRRPPCCRKSVCQICWSSYLQAGKGVIYDGIKPSTYDLHCYGCSKLVPYRQALAATEPSQLTLLRRDGSDLLAHCPVCLNEVKPKETSLSFLTKSKDKYLQVTCDRCKHIFCSRCGADAHPKNSCYDVTHADAGLSLWMKEQHPMHADFQNCRFCPNCHIPISHNGGCPWLKCVCGYEFCFACGKEKQKWNGWHRQKAMRVVPLFTCTRLWKSQVKRVFAQSLFSLFFIFFLIPLLVAFLPLIVIICMFVLAIFARLPSNHVTPG